MPAVDCCEFTGAPVVGDTAAVITIESGSGGDVSGITIYAEGCSQVANDNCEYQDTYCLAPNHRLLTSDLLWIPCGEIEKGQELLAFEETKQSRNRGRRFQRSTVLKSEPTMKECVRVQIVNGDEIICSIDHPWLGMKMTQAAQTRRWIKAADLLRRGYFVTRVFDAWEPDASYEGGWLAGMYDGEGCLTNVAALKTVIAQKPGQVLDAIVETLQRFKFEAQITAGTNVNQVYLGGGLKEQVRLLGQIRPMRLLTKFAQMDLSRRMIKTPDTFLVEAVEPIGLHEVQSIATSTHTYIGEGYLMHNSDTYRDVTAGGANPNATVTDFSFTINDMPPDSILIIDAAEQSVSLTDNTGNVHASQLEAIDWNGLFEWIVAAKNGCQKICIDSTGATLNGDTNWTISTFDREL